MLEEVKALLIDIGFDPVQTRKAFNSLLDRYEDGLGQIGFNPEEVGKIMGGNWLRLYETVFG